MTNDLNYFTIRLPVSLIIAALSLSAIFITRKHDGDGLSHQTLVSIPLRCLQLASLRGSEETVFLARNAELKSESEERKWGFGHNLDWKHKEVLWGVGSAECVVLATIHHFQYLPVRGAHQRPCAFCFSTRLWMKELAKAQFQLFIAHKPARWGGKKRGMKHERVRACGVCVFSMIQIISALFFETNFEDLSVIRYKIPPHYNNHRLFFLCFHSFSSWCDVPLKHTSSRLHPPSPTPHHHMPRTSGEGRNRI